jgi:predicted Fe-Mo cluster-binding NifX family protein
MRAAIPTNDGIMMAGSFEQAKGFLIFDIELGQVTKEEVVWNKTAYAGETPENYLTPIINCSAAFANNIPEKLCLALQQKGISLINSKDDIITNVIFHYMDNEIKKAADCCCCP